MYLIFLITGLATLLSVYLLYIFVAQYRFLSNSEYEIEDVENFDSFADFKIALRTIVKFYVKKIYKNFNFLTHYLYLIFIKSIQGIQYIFSIFYKKQISLFLEKSIQNKTYVKFFWNDLKKFKKEIDLDNDL